MQLKNTFYIFLYLIFASLGSANGANVFLTLADGDCCTSEKLCCVADMNCCIGDSDDQDPVTAHWISSNPQLYFFTVSIHVFAVKKIGWSTISRVEFNRGNDPPPKEKSFLQYHQLIFYA